MIGDATKRFIEDTVRMIRAVTRLFNKIIFMRLLKQVLE
jgi:tRNA nucleotidyltransferase/poly(A) polymerase